jgi:hypothetical protein
VAARRLVIVMLILLGASTLAAALVPVPASDDEEQEKPSAKPPAPRQTGQLERRSIRVGGEEPAPEIRISVGDQLQLTVRAPRPDEVEIPAFGEVRDVGPGTPAFFDLLPFQPGEYAVRLIAADRIVGRILVEKRVDEGPTKGA